MVVVAAIEPVHERMRLSSRSLSSGVEVVGADQQCRALVDHRQRSHGHGAGGMSDDHCHIGGKQLGYSRSGQRFIVAVILDQQFDRTAVDAALTVDPGNGPSSAPRRQSTPRSPPALPVSPPTNPKVIGSGRRLISKTAVSTSSVAAIAMRNVARSLIACHFRPPRQRSDFKSQPTTGQLFTCPSRTVRSCQTGTDGSRFWPFCRLFCPGNVCAQCSDALDVDADVVFRRDGYTTDI